MARITSRFLIITTLLLSFVVSSCSTSGESFIFKTEILNASSMTAYDLDFEGGSSKLLLIPLERFRELKFVTFTLPGTNKLTGLLDVDENEFKSIPLAENIDVEIVGVKPGTYVFAIKSFGISEDNIEEIGPMLLMVETNGGLFPYALEVDEGSEQLLFDPGPLYLAFLE